MDATSTPVRAVLFDADGVVQTNPPDWRGHVAAMCGQTDQVDEFVEAVFAAERPCLVGQGDFATSLSQVLARWESPFSVEQALEIWTMVKPEVSNLGIVQELRACNVLTALATNQQQHRARFMVEELGYAQHFDHLLISCDLGVAKPDVAYFQACARVLECAPEELLFIDDHDRNVEAARSAGLNAQQYHLDEGTARLRDLLIGYNVLA